MKRTPFLRKPTHKGFKPRKAPLKRSAFTKSSYFPKGVVLRRADTPKKRVARRVATQGKGYKTPPWFNKLRIGSHGSNPAQKRYWAFTSDRIRKEEFERYGGKCVSCSRILHSWQEGQCAHYKAWSVCNGYFKYERKNLALSCAYCNHTSDGAIGYAFGEALKKRYGNDHLTWIDHENQKHRGEKMEDWEIVARVEESMLSPHLD